MIHCDLCGRPLNFNDGCPNCTINAGSDTPEIVVAPPEWDWGADLLSGESSTFTDELLEAAYQQAYDNQVAALDHIKALTALLSRCEAVLGDFASPDEGESAVYIGNLTSDEVAALWREAKEAIRT